MIRNTQNASSKELNEIFTNLELPTAVPYNRQNSSTYSILTCMLENVHIMNHMLKIFYKDLV
jgi:hypothetical protein